MRITFVSQVSRKFLAMRHESEVFRRDVVIKEVEKVRRRSLPLPTFYRWLSEGLCISPKRWYSQNEIDTLKRLCDHLALGNTLEEFREQLLQEQQAND